MQQPNCNKNIQFSCFVVVILVVVVVVVVVTICIYFLQVQAIFDFIPQPNCPDELPMKKGDIIVILEETDKNWWTGRNKSNNRKGLFPANHVQKGK